MTGDLGAQDQQGVLRLCGRVQETIPYGGGYIRPEEIESIASGLPGVREACAFSVPTSKDAVGGIGLAVVPQHDQKSDTRQIRDSIWTRVKQRPLQVRDIVTLNVSFLRCNLLTVVAALRFGFQMLFPKASQGTFSVDTWLRR